MLTSQTQSPGRPAIQTPGGGRGPGAAPDANDPANANADLSPKPPVLPSTPAEQAKRVLAAARLSPGARAVRSDHRGSRRRSRSTATAACSSSSCAATSRRPKGIDLIPPIGRISMHEDRDNDGVYEHHTVFVDKLVFPRFVMPFGANTHPDDGDQRGRSVEVHRHQRRRRRGQEGAVHDELRARRQHGVAAGQPVLGDGQLALQHGQRVPPALDAERPPEGADRARTARSGA